MKRDNGPAEAYRARLNTLQQREAELKQADRRFVTAKLVIIALGVLLAIWLVKYHAGLLVLLVVPLAIFAATFVFHERVLRRLRITSQQKSFYERGLARLEDRWAGTGRTGERFLEETHPYARDLDIFGKGGLFELLCTARTSAGEATLAAWLLTPAAENEIRLRQDAVRELTTRLDFQERLAIAGENLKGKGEAEARIDDLVHWCETANQPVPRWARIAAPVLAALWLLGVGLWFVSQFGIGVQRWGVPLIAISLLNVALNSRWKVSVAETASSLEETARELPLLAAVFAEIAGERFIAEKLVWLQKRLKPEGVDPSRAIGVLNRDADYILSRDNLIVKVMDPFLFWTTQWGWAAQRWRDRFGTQVRGWISATAEVEALAAFGLFAHERPEYVFSEFVSESPFYEAEGMAHPLVAGDAVGNDLKLGDGRQLILISGPNMAGKSTFIRSVGVNAVLAQAGAPVRARRMVLSRFQVAASICILDSLQGGLSRFYAEITRLKQIDDLSRGSTPVLFVLDELLSGTNSHDRRVGTESVVRGLLAHGAVGLVTTHDLALTAIVETLPGRAANFHFGDTFADGKLSFDYRLLAGVAESTNALKLMEAIGLTNS